MVILRLRLPWTASTLLRKLRLTSTLPSAAPPFTSSPLRSSAVSPSPRYANSDSESSASEPIDIRPLSRIGYPEPTYTPDSLAGKTWVSSSAALDAPLSPPRYGFSSSPAKTPPSNKSNRRRSSTSLLDVSSPSPARSSLVGSYEQSLLSGRMSTLPSKPLPFLAEIGVLGGIGGKGKGKLRSPPHLHLDFGAVYYGDAASPYVGAIDLEQHYIDELLATRTAGLGVAEEEAETKGPRFPGYRLPSPTGQIQLVIKNPSKAPVKLFLIPYDLSHLQAGEKTFIRQKLHADDGAGPLQYAVHLPFCSPPRSTRGAPRLYLHGTIRVVFHATAARSSTTLQAVYDQPAPSLYGGPGEDWLDARRLLVQPPPRPPTPAFDPDGADEEAIAVHAERELTFEKRPCTPLARPTSGLSGSRPGSRTDVRDALR